MSEKHIADGNMAPVRRLISAPVADYTSLTMLESDEGFENNVLDAYILRVQKFEREVQVKNRGAKGGTAGAIYDRVVLMMEVRERRAFCVLCDKTVSFTCTFMIRNDQWVGRKVTVFEPVIRRMMYGLPIVEMFDPFVPIDNELNLKEPICPITIEIHNLAVHPFRIIA